VESLGQEGLAGLEHLLETGGVGGDGRVGLEDAAGEGHGQPGLGHVEEDGVHLPVEAGDGGGERRGGAGVRGKILADVGVVHGHEVRELVLRELLPVMMSVCGWVVGAVVRDEMG
jgi:hypothetical protein